jgi:dihydroorotate dehydrogenase (fumarate)
LLKVAFAKDSLSSLNSYGYSPHPLSTYLGWIQELIEADPTSSKPFIISVTASSPVTLERMMDDIQGLRRRLDDQSGDSSRIAIELNTSCPNIIGTTPPAYDFTSLLPSLSVLSEKFWKDTTLTIGLKLAPFVHATQFDDVIRGISLFSAVDDSGKRKNPFAFLTCTNTLGSCLLFPDQVMSPISEDAVPQALGGLAGESIHALSLGNVYKFSRLLTGSADEAMRSISIIGVGGVTSKEAVERMKKAGAKVVGCATFFGKEGISAFEKLS